MDGFIESHGHGVGINEEETNHSRCTVVFYEESIGATRSDPPLLWAVGVNLFSCENYR
jgi:hypothetical protein